LNGIMDVSSNKNPEQLPPQDAEVYLDQVRHLYSGIGVTATASLINATLMAFVHRNMVSVTIIVSWLTFIIFTILLRAVLVAAFRNREISPDRAQVWARLYVSAIALSGIGWGSAALFLMPEHSVPHQFFTAFVLGGMTAGALATLHAIPGAFTAFAIPVLLPMILKFFQAADEMHVIMGIMVSLFLLLLLTNARRQSETLVTTLSLKYQKLDFASRLQRQSETMKILNENLKVQLYEQEKIKNALRSSERELAEKSRILQTTLDSIDQGFAVWDKNHQIVAWNKQCEKFWYDPDFHIRKNPQMLDLLRHVALKGQYGPGDPDKLAAQEYQKVIARGVPSEDEFSMLDGRVVHVRRYAMPQGGHVSTYTDITLQKHAEEALRDSEERYRSIFATTQVGISLTDWNGKYIECNEAWHRMLGYTKDEILTLSNLDISHPDDEEISNENLKNLMAGTLDSYRLEKRYRRKDGTVFWGDITVNPVRDANGRVIASMGMCIDVTERKRVDEIKDEFISTISHELRTPLTSIRGSLGLISSGRLGEIPEKAADMLALGYRNVERLITLVNDILDFEKLESGEMEFKFARVDLPELVNEAIAANQTYANQHGVAFSLASADDVSVWADNNRLTQVLANLMSNAAKFSPRGERVEIAIAKTDSGARVTVSDRGPGIPADFRDRIFERFSQADSSDTRKSGGTGLGLAISQGIIERHKGMIGFEDRNGGGTTFYFEIPRQPGNG